MKTYKFEARGGLLTQRDNTHGSSCDWCGKPRYMWTNRIRYRGLGTFYCSARCYAAGEYRINLYFALCSISVLGMGVSFLSFQLLSTPSEFYVGVAQFVVAIFLTYSSICACCPAVGQSERRKRESASSENQQFNLRFE
ncbi:MAG: hypothetical protein EAX95_00965 [Candidatus Thorarchaeota archaeon]|nr:hypothetical protein [Candidatus Thorarchaeota archaeon]